MKRLLVLVLLLAGCGEPITHPTSEPTTRFDNGWASIKTVEHEGHRYVVARWNSGVAMILHPDDGLAERAAK